MATLRLTIEIERDEYGTIYGIRDGAKPIRMWPDRNRLHKAIAARLDEVESEMEDALVQDEASDDE